jgi:hypothetical protein
VGVHWNLEHDEGGEAEQQDAVRWCSRIADPRRRGDCLDALLFQRDR